MLSLLSQSPVAFTAPHVTLPSMARTVSMQASGRIDVRDMPGIAAPLGFFDPLGFTKDASDGKIKFYREVELKHGRVAMLASVGFLFGEQFHPMFGGSVDVPSYIAFQETPLQGAMPLVLFVVAIHEVFSVFTFNSPFGGELWSIRSDYENGNLGWDPLGFKPSDPAELKAMKTKEINNGRLAMLAIAGMVRAPLQSRRRTAPCAHSRVSG